jgi:parallel beta-helix repeat protein
MSHVSYHHGQTGTREERTSERNMNAVTLRRALSVCVLAGSLALALALAAGAGPVEAKSLVVGPGESIQKAIYAADPGDTIVVRGVHREDVVIRKNGIKLRGEDAVIEAPPKAKADSPCSKVFGPEGICILGGVNLQNGELTGPRVSDVGVSGFTFRGFEQTEDVAFAIEAPGARDASIVGNRFMGNGSGAIGLGSNIDTTVAKNHIVANPKAASSEGIVVGGDSRNTNIVNNVVKNIPEGDQSAIVVEEATATTVADNDLEENGFGAFVFDSTGTKMLSNDITDTTSVGTVILESTGTKMVSNDISRYGDSGISIFGSKPANLKVVGNNISGGPAGIYVADTKGGSFTGNTIHHNCAGMFFEADGSKEPVSGFEVKANTVENNTRSCPKGFERKVSGVGIALLGTTNMEVTANRLSGNVPSGPTRISGGVVVSTDQPFGGSAKLRNNSVIGNHFGRNKPDIFWDKSGSGNSFLGNLCDTSVPSRLCN